MKVEESQTQTKHKEVVKLIAGALDLYNVLQTLEVTDDADLLCALDERLLLTSLFKWAVIEEKGEGQKPAFAAVLGFATMKCTYLKPEVPGPRIFCKDALEKAA